MHRLTSDWLKSATVTDLWPDRRGQQDFSPPIPACMMCRTVSQHRLFLFTKYKYMRVQQCH